MHRYARPCDPKPACVRGAHLAPALLSPPHLRQEQVEPLMMQYKPPGLIKKIYFQKLTFGDDPFRHVV